MENTNYLIDLYGRLQDDITEVSVLASLAQRNAVINKAYSDRFFNEQRDVMLHVIVDRFGLGRLMANRDQVGGNVDTIHNARAGVYATEAERQNYINREEYNSDDYYNQEQYIQRNRKAKISQEKSTLIDGYTGQTIKRNQKIDQDHIKNKKSIHDDPGRVLAGEDGPNLANQDFNLLHTDRSINCGKKEISAVDYADKLDQTRPKRQKRIDELQKKEMLNDREQKELNKLIQHEKVNTDEMRKKGESAEAKYEYIVNMRYYFSPKFITNLGRQSAIQGAQMGIRQITGVFLVEAIAAAFDEIRDACRIAHKITGSWILNIRERLNRILNRISSKWQEALSEGLNGAISGFLSNMLTVLINAFVTTSKNIVRLIRESFFSMIKATKLLMNPPMEMSNSTLYHEAGKLIITGGMVSFGKILEESVNLFPPMIAIKGIPVLGDMMGDIVYGFMVALVTALALWGWNKLDLFGAKEEWRHKQFLIASGFRHT